ncbi:hypothetical protein [Janthinobacterium sp. NKUCC08_JDC]|uniref:hypothetical protein n=1 Tax=Janthinobacterium sp. NKUCC08_JDC TaxID=2842122 RepID=UPI001C5AABD4|nr:hypothetical protein [Janthinobacterium sp. NKUCC08_JDC]MBW3502561.1 hypothetical protein [Janthinobacterium sp. NKUCC08_JDC]
MSSIVIFSELGEIKIVDEPSHTFGSQDNVHRYAQEKNLQPVYTPTSTHGVFLNGDPVVVFGAPGGCSSVHKHSALVLNSNLLLAVGDSVLCFSLNDLKLIWASVVDDATCFGIYYESKRMTLISHGELNIARLDENGKILWSSSGADIFSEGFRLEEEYIVVTDFNQRNYRINYETGVSV